ncbi:unnamed protein product [Dibothriocephalus latus]|uniref:Uncharacterized protein n=1 Tax=Dibothriocephalus latus TaxID=60516 RepID=A0A3P7NNV3_DIBLA|nr:unnamed protein product [Dibothriocephalus latus]
MRVVGVLLTVVAYILAVEVINDTAAPNMPFALVYNFNRTVESVTLGGISVSTGSPSNPCQPGKSCWQPLTAREYSVLWYSPDAGVGTIILKPLVLDKFASAIIIKDQEVVEGDGLVKELNLNVTEETEVLILYSEEVEHTDALGNVKYFDGGPEEVEQHLFFDPLRMSLMFNANMCFST